LVPSGTHSILPCRRSVFLLHSQVNTKFISLCFNHLICS
jgi:hypothetical protein